MEGLESGNGKADSGEWDTEKSTYTSTTKILTWMCAVVYPWLGNLLPHTKPVS